MNDSGISTKEALEGSIRQWEDIVQTTTAMDQGTHNFPLCMLFLQNNCQKCPVYLKTAAPGKLVIECARMPYVFWLMHQNFDHKKWMYSPYQSGESVKGYTRIEGCGECLILAQAELEFLRSLRG